MSMFKISPKCPPKRGFRSWRERLTYVVFVAVWFGLTTVGYDQAIASGLVDGPSRGLAAVFVVMAWIPLFVASFIWQRWGRAAFPLHESASEPSEA